MGKRLTTDIFKRRACAIHGGFYDYSKVKYVSIREKVIIICPHHGEFAQTLELHVVRKHGCPHCGRKRSGPPAISNADFFKRVKFIHNGKYKYLNLNFKNAKEKISIICSKHGEFRCTVASHLSNDPPSGCPKCARIAHRLSTEDFITRANILFNNFYDYSKTSYTTCYKNLIIICPCHGEISLPAITHFRIGCFKCRKNKMEDRWLDYIGVVNDGTSRQVLLKLSNGRNVRVDGYNKLSKTVYLFHGDYWHGNPAIYKAGDLNTVIGISYGELYQNTLTYEKDILNSGYNLKVIWENEWVSEKPRNFTNPSTMSNRKNPRKKK